MKQIKFNCLTADGSTYYFEDIKCYSTGNYFKPNDPRLINRCVGNGVWCKTTNIIQHDILYIMNLLLGIQNQSIAEIKQVKFVFNY